MFLVKYEEMQRNSRDNTKQTMLSYFYRGPLKKKEKENKMIYKNNDK